MQEITEAVKALNISADTCAEASQFMEDFIPTLTGSTNSIRLTIFGIACYNAGKESAKGA